MTKHRELKVKVVHPKYGVGKEGITIRELLELIAEGAVPPLDEETFLISYTGLKDKNRKEIYEGDILKFQHYNTFVEGDCEYITTVYWENGEYKNTCNFSEESREVIGNVHENQELLEDTQQNRFDGESQ